MAAGIFNRVIPRHLIFLIFALLITSIITGSLLLSLLHAVIPNHWLPMIAIGRKEGWSINEVTRVTFISAIAHGTSTIIIGIIMALIGSAAINSAEEFVHIAAPVILIIIGIIFIYRHHSHHHFHIKNEVKRKKSKSAIITALVVAMFFSPCMEIEAYFLLAGTEGFWLVGIIALLYLVITTAGMVLLVRFAYSGLLKLNWHKLEHNAGIISGITLVVTGVLTYFIH